MLEWCEKNNPSTDVFDIATNAKEQWSLENSLSFYQIRVNAFHKLADKLPEPYKTWAIDIIANGKMRWWDIDKAPERPALYYLVCLDRLTKQHEWLEDYTESSLITTSTRDKAKMFYTPDAAQAAIASIRGWQVSTQNLNPLPWAKVVRGWW